MKGSCHHVYIRALEALERRLKCCEQALSSFGTAESGQQAGIDNEREAYQRERSRLTVAIRALKRVLDEAVLRGAVSRRCGSDEQGAVPSVRNDCRCREAPPGRTVDRSSDAWRTVSSPLVRPVVLIQGEIKRVACIDLAREWGWDLLDLDLTEQIIPEGVKPAGILTSKLSTDSVVQRLIKEGVPAVRMGIRPNPQDRVMPAVLPDLAEVGRMAARHFIERGFKTVAHVAWDSDDPESVSHLIYHPFREWAEARDVSVHVHNVQGRRRASDGVPGDDLTKYEHRTLGVRAWLGELPKPVGVLAINDAYAASARVMCGNEGIAVPEEVALLGVGNTASICELSMPTLSSVDTAVDVRVRRSMALLHDLMAGGSKPDAPIMVLPAEIVVRQSTDLLAVDDPAAARALRYIWENLDQDVSVDDVARVAGVGRRQLERHFRAALGRTVNAEIRRKRLEHCCLLLQTTELPVADIAPLSGFSSSGYLTKVFRQTFGTTPMKWRSDAGASA